MFTRKSGRARYSWAAVTVLVTPALVGAFNPAVATASPLPSDARASSISTVSTNPSHRLSLRTAPVNSSPASTPEPIKESRGAVSALLKLFAAGVKKVPGLWNSFAAGVKKAYTWFSQNTWKVVKGIASAISFLLNAYEVWKGFH